MRRVKQIPSKLTKGLALGWGIPETLDKEIQRALPHWAIVTTSDAPRSLTFRDYSTARLLTNAPRETTLVLFGLNDGTFSTRTVLISGFVKVHAAVMAGMSEEIDPRFLKRWLEQGIDVSVFPPGPTVIKELLTALAGISQTKRG